MSRTRAMGWRSRQVSVMSRCQEHGVTINDGEWRGDTSWNPRVLLGSLKYCPRRNNLRVLRQEDMASQRRWLPPGLHLRQTSRRWQLRVMHMVVVPDRDDDGHEDPMKELSSVEGDSLHLPGRWKASALPGLRSCLGSAVSSFLVINDTLKNCLSLLAPSFDADGELGRKRSSYLTGTVVRCRGLPELPRYSLPFTSP